MGRKTFYDSINKQKYLDAYLVNYNIKRPQKAGAKTAKHPTKSSCGARGLSRFLRFWPPVVVFPIAYERSEVQLVECGFATETPRV